MRDETGFLSYDFQLTLQRLLADGLQVQGDTELLCSHHTVLNPRNRLLTIPGLRLDLPVLLDEALLGVSRVFDDSHERALIQLAQHPRARAIRTSLPGFDLPLHWLIRQNRLHLFCGTEAADVLHDLQRLVFVGSMVQEAMQTRLRAILPNLELGFLRLSIDCLYLRAGDSALATSIAELERIHDVQMVPMSDVRAADWRLVQAGEPPEYWRTLIAALRDDDSAALHALFGETE